MKFMVDHMLIKLGKYLRIAGYDAEWDPSTGTEQAMRTHELINRANAEGRVFLTRNTRLPDQYPAPNQCVYVAESDPVKQLHELAGSMGLDIKSRMFSKCIKCNVELAGVADKREIEPMVHPNVYKRHDEFYRCPKCGTVFWKGTHVQNTLVKLGISEGM